MTKQFTFGSVCSGIEAASVAWHPLGGRAVWLAEIEAFPSAVLAHHYPDVPNLGDMTTIAAQVRGGDVEAPDVLVGGTPCQAFSVAGLRGGLSDPRGALTLAYVELANAIDTARLVRGDAECVAVWENVPGVLSSKDNAFGCFLGALAGEECELEPEPRPAAGKSSRHWRWDKSTGAHAPSWPLAGCVFGPQRAIAWRVLDAQYFGVAQRRRRVFVVASARTGFDPAAILFEFDGVRRDTAPSREAGQDAAGDAGSGSAVEGGTGGVATAFGGNRTGGPIDITPALLAQGGSGYKGDFESETFLVGSVGTLRQTDGGADVDHAMAGHLVTCVTGDIAHTLKADGFDASEDGTGSGTPIVPVAGQDVRYAYYSEDYANDRITDVSGVNPALTARTTASGNLNVLAPIAFPANLSGTQCASAEDLAPTIGAANPTAVAVQASQSGVRINETIGTLDANYGSRRHNGVMQDMQVRRLTPRECERLQAFPEVIETLTISACIDHQKSIVNAAIQCRRSQSNAWSAAERGSLRDVNAAEKNSCMHQAVQEPLVAVIVRMNSGDDLQDLRYQGKSIWSANGAVVSSQSRPHTLTENTVQLLARLQRDVVKTIRSGKVELPLNISLFFPALSGVTNVEKFGQETTAGVSDVSSGLNKAMYTTSDLGRITTCSDSTAEILCCSVLHAIAGCIPSTTLPETFSIELTVETPYTAIDWRKKPATECPDGPRYKALGNSMCVYNMRWIGRRLRNYLLAAK